MIGHFSASCGATPSLVFHSHVKKRIFALALTSRGPSMHLGALQDFLPGVPKRESVATLPPALVFSGGPPTPVPVEPLPGSLVQGLEVAYLLSWPTRSRVAGFPRLTLLQASSIDRCTLDFLQVNKMDETFPCGNLVNLKISCTLKILTSKATVFFSTAARSRSQGATGSQGRAWPSTRATARSTLPQEKGDTLIGRKRSFRVSLQEVSCC